MRKWTAVFLLAAVAALSIFALTGCSLNIETDIQSFTAGDGEAFKVGIISDSQLPPNDSGNYTFKNNLTKAIGGLKARNVDMILFVGDITDEASEYAYQTYMQCYDEVYGEEKRPIIQHIMGNHDYWGGHDGNVTQKDYRDMFEKQVGQSPFTHYEVNGFHFIGASPDSGNMEAGYKKVAKWLDGEIAKAVQDDPAKPVFVMTHNSAKDTVYGSDDWGDTSLSAVLSKYEQVVSISGHLHYSIMDERSMWQGEFTAFSTQSVSYTELEEGKANGTIPPKHSDTPMGLVMDISDTKVDIHRINFGANVIGGQEEKADMLWTLPIPLTKDKFAYTSEQRAANNAAPAMTAETGSYDNIDGVTTLRFSAGSDDDFVHSYKLVFSYGTEQLYFTDFINGISGMAKDVVLPIYDMAAGTYDVRIYAVDSYGRVSDSYITINGIQLLAASYK